jgi:hypothetical protein
VVFLIVVPCSLLVVYQCFLEHAVSIFRVEVSSVRSLEGYVWLGDQSSWPNPPPISVQHIKFLTVVALTLKLEAAYSPKHWHTFRRLHDTMTQKSTI